MRHPGQTAVVAALAAGLLQAAAAQSGPVIRLTDITTAAGLRFKHATGATGRKYLPETLGSGAAIFDADGDGRQDILLLSGTSLAEDAPRTDTALRLFRNAGAASFEDITAKAGLSVAMYAMGAAAADFDNDGHQDILVTGVGQSRLFRNGGDGRFADVTERAGLGGRTGFSTAAAWVDYDRDGLLDLLICNYVRWTPKTDVFCSADGKTKSYCTPEAYPGATSWLYRNKGNGTFEDVTAAAGLFDPTSKALGVTVLDFDLDGWPDLFVANDTQPNKLYRNRRDRTFQEVGVQAGLAFSEDGRARAGMGTDAADLDNSGLPSLAVTNFSGEMLGLYVPVKPGVYADRAPGSAVGKATRHTLGFGCFFFDADLDGLLDLLVVNGHIDDRVAQTGRVNYAEVPHLFHNRGKGEFVDIAREAGAEFAQPKVGRGAAFGDLDLDGDLDVLLTTNGGPAALYRNDLTGARGAVRVTLRGTRSNRDGIGSLVRAKVGQTWQTRMVRTGSSYLSQSELPVTFGLGAADAIGELTVAWPSGAKDQVWSVRAGRAYVITEGRGITSDTALAR